LPAKVPVDQVADVLGYSSVEHLRRAVRNGPLAALGVASAEPVWPRDVVRAAARDRAAAGVSAKALAELHGRGSLAQWHGALVEARAEVLPA
jgi:hypothetical protein